MLDNKQVILSPKQKIVKLDPTPTEVPTLPTEGPTDSCGQSLL